MTTMDRTTRRTSRDRSRARIADGWASAPCSARPRRCSYRLWRPRTRSATSRSTTTPGSGSSPTGSCSTSSSTRPRSPPSRHASTSTPTATARSPTPRPTPAGAPPARSWRRRSALTVDGGGPDPDRGRGRARRSRPASAACRRCASCAASRPRWRRPLAAGSTIGYRRRLVPGPARLARDRGQRLRRSRSQRRTAASFASDEHLGPAHPLPDEPADAGARRHVGRDDGHPRRPDPPAARHPRCEPTARGRRSRPPPTTRRRRPSGAVVAAPVDGGRHRRLLRRAGSVPGGVTQRRPAVDLPHGRPLAAGAPRLDPDRGRPRRGPRAHPRARQDADGRLPRRDARDAAPRRRARPVGDAVAHDRDPRAGRRSSSGAQGLLPPDLVVQVGAGHGGRLDRRDRRLDAVRRGPAALAPPGRDGHARRTRASARHPRARRTTMRDHDARQHDHDHDHGRTTTTTNWRTGEHSHGGVRHSHLPPAGDDDLVAQPVRPRPRRRADPVGQRAADPARLDRRRPAGLRVRPRRRASGSGWRW